MEEDDKKEKEDYAPYMTSIWGYLIIFLIIIPIVLYLGRQFGRRSFVSLISLNKRAKTPTAVAYTPWSDDSGRAAEEDMKFYLYWPPAVIMVLLATGSYAIGMYFS